jgi:amidase
MTDADLCFTPATRLAEMIRRRRLSPLELTQVLLARIRRLNPRVNAYCTVAEDHALASARRATAALRRGVTLGALHGVPVSIKDLTPTRGIRTTWGSRLFADHVPDADGLVVERLRAAGAIVLGKTNTPEFGAGANTRNDLFGPTRNPWNLALTSGGSTGGGAAAVAAGLGPLAQGSDLGGSLRVPAAFCGVVGLRPSPGLVPAFPSELAWDTYGVQGPMARTVADVALLLRVMAGPDPRSPLSYPVEGRHFTAAVRRPTVRGLRVAWGGDLGVTPVEEEVLAVARDALAVFRRLGARVAEARPDFHDLPEIVRVSRAARMVGLHGDKLATWREVMQVHLVRNIEAGLSLTAADVMRAERLRTQLYHRVRTFFAHYDLLLTPTAPVKPFPVEEWYPKAIDGHPVRDYIDWLWLTYAFTVVGLPALSVPCGFTRDGLPVGLQIVGRWHDEATVLAAAAAYEAATPWTQQRPPEPA